MVQQLREAPGLRRDEDSPRVVPFPPRGSQRDDNHSRKSDSTERLGRGQGEGSLTLASPQPSLETSSGVKGR